MAAGKRLFECRSAEMRSFRRECTPRRFDSKSTAHRATPRCTDGGGCSSLAIVAHESPGYCSSAHHACLPTYLEA